MINIYAGNLSYSTTDSGLNDAFAEFGDVKSAKVIMDRESGRSKGFGFVEMTSDDEGKKAIEALDGTDLDGRTIKVNEARPRPDRR